MAVVTIEYEHSICTLCPRRSVFVEVFKPFHTSFTVCSSIFCSSKRPIAREVGFGVPAGEVMLTFEQYIWRQAPTFPINAVYDCGPSSITRLNLFSSSFSFRACNDHRRCYYTDHKASVVKVIEVAIGDPIFRPHVLNQSKPRVSIFA